MNFLKRKSLQFYLKFLSVFNFSDVTIAKVKYYYKTNDRLDLKNPVEFMEKITWLKLFLYTERYGYLVDKYEVRNYVENKIGKVYLNEIIDVYDDVDEINIKELPQKFVLKGTHGSGYNIIVPDKSLLDWEDAKKKLKKFLRKNYYYKYGERIYKDIKPRIIAEEYLDQLGNDNIVDYKFYCFHGKSECIWVKTFHGDKHRNCYYSLDWKRIEYDTNAIDYLPKEMEKPSNLDEMIEVAEKLSKGFIFIRVDLYSIQGKIYFGELTFFPWGGNRRLTIEALNKEYGDLMLLPI